MSEPVIAPWLSGFCCAPRTKDPLGEDILTASRQTPEEVLHRASSREVLNAERHAYAVNGTNVVAVVVEQQPSLMSDSENGSASTEPKEDGTTTTGPAMPKAMSEVALGQRCRELGHLQALLDSKDCSAAERQSLLAYAAQPDGQRACLAVLKAQVAGEPRSLLPGAFATMQELLGQLMLDAMQRESAEELRILVAVSHAITLEERADRNDGED